MTGAARVLVVAAVLGGAVAVERAPLAGQAPEPPFLQGRQAGWVEPRLAGLQWRFVRVKYHANSLAGRRFRMQVPG